MTLPVDHHIKALRPALNVMATLGFGPQECLRGSGLTVADLEDPKATLTRAQEWHIHRRLLALSGDPLLGLKLGSAYRLETYGVLGYAMLSAATLSEAVKLATEYELLTFTHFRLALHTANDTAMLTLHQHGEIPDDLLPLYEDRELAAVITGGEQALGVRLQANRIAMMHSARQVKRYEAFFACPVQFKQAHTEFRFDASLLLAPMPLRDPETSQYCRKQCEQLLARLSVSGDFVARVRSLLIARPRTFANVNALAAQLHMSPRSVRRRLQQEGTSFQRVLDEIRYQLALDYLHSPLSLEQIADLLGYSEASNFSHAFKRWHGSAPQAYRHSLSVKGAG